MIDSLPMLYYGRKWSVIVRVKQPPLERALVLLDQGTLR